VELRYDPAASANPTASNANEPVKTIISLTVPAVVLASLVSVAEAQTPIIQTQPTNETVLAGGNASFSVAVSGTGPFTYQWQFNGTNIPDGVITTVAGDGVAGYSGDGGPAPSAELNSPGGAAVDAFGNLFIADFDNTSAALLMKLAWLTLAWY